MTWIPVALRKHVVSLGLQMMGEDYPNVGKISLTYFMNIC